MAMRSMPKPNAQPVQTSGIVADVLEHLRMHHAAAGNLQPVLAHLLHQRVGEINLVARLGVAEVVRAETNLHVARP